MRGSALRAIRTRVDRLAGRVQSETVVDWDERVEILKSARTKPRRTVAPEISAERSRALWAWKKAIEND